MKTILFLTAHPSEQKVLASHVKQYSFPGIRFQFANLWMGNFQALASLIRLLEKEHESIDFVVNIGLAWVIDTSYTYPCYQIARIVSVANGREILPPQPLHFAPLVSLLSVEKEVRSGESILEPLVDMESYGIAFALEKYQIPYLFLKIPADDVSKPRTKEMMGLFLGKFSLIQYDHLISAIEQYLQGIPPSDNLMDIKNQYRLTFAEHQIFLSYVRSYEALTGKSIREFLAQAEWTNKKHLLTTLHDAIYS